MLNPNEAYARKNPIRATISNAGASIYHASEFINGSLKVGVQVTTLAYNALEVLIKEQRNEIAQIDLELSKQAKASFDSL